MMEKHPNNDRITQKKREYEGFIYLVFILGAIFYLVE